MAPLFNSRKVPETPLKTGNCSNSSGSAIFALWSGPTSMGSVFLLVSAPVGQDTMHSPQETHEESPIGKL